MSTPDPNGGPVVFTAKVNFASQAALLYVWRFDTNTVTTKVDTAISSFATTGKHAVHLDVRRTGDNAEMCSADTFVVVLAGDSTKSITPDSLSANLLTRYTFRAHLPSLRTSKNYKLVWTIDSAKFVRFNTDTISTAFIAVGAHFINVCREDTTTGNPIETASTIANVSCFTLKITPSTGSPTVLSSMNFSVNTTAGDVPSTHYLWDFGDGTTVDNYAVNSITHSFSFAGNLQVKVSLFQGSVLLASDSTSVNVLPSVKGFSVASFTGFRRGTARFVGTTAFGCLGFDYTGDSLAWNGLQFSYSTGSQSGGATNNSFSGHYFLGRVSQDGLTLDSLVASARSGYHTEYQVGSSTKTHYGSSHSNLSCVSLQLIWGTPDSVCYGVIGPKTKDNVTATRDCSEVSNYLPGGYDWQYPGTDWNSRNPIPSVTVTFYKK